MIAEMRCQDIFCGRMGYSLRRADRGLMVQEMVKGKSSNMGCRMRRLEDLLAAQRRWAGQSRAWAYIQMSQQRPKMTRGYCEKEMVLCRNFSEDPRRTIWLCGGLALLAPRRNVRTKHLLVLKCPKTFLTIAPRVTASTSTIKLFSAFHNV